MRRAASFALLALALSPAALDGRVRAEAPLMVARDFLRAVNSRDCERAWTYLSAASRAYITCKSKEMTASAPYAASAFSARNLYCVPTSVHRYHSYQPDTARLESVLNGRAVISLERHDAEGFLMPGFFPTRHRAVPVKMTLAEEGGRWLIHVPASSSGPRSNCSAPPS